LAERHGKKAEEKVERKLEKKVVKQRPAEVPAPVKKVSPGPAPVAGKETAAPEASQRAAAAKAAPAPPTVKEGPEEAPRKAPERPKGPAERPAAGKTEEAGSPPEEGEVEAEIMEEEDGAGAEEKDEKAEKGEKGAGKAKKGKGRKKAAPTIKPTLGADVVRAMALRKVLKGKTPRFIRQEAYNYKRLAPSWRRPKGTHSKLRHHIRYRINVVSIGYGGPAAARGLHPSGFAEVLVHHPLDLDRVDPKTMAARIARGVGTRKRRMIEQRAERKGIRILNRLQE